MSSLPEKFYKERAPQPPGSLRLHPRIVLWLLLALASGWVLFELPGAPVHRLRLPEDIQAFGVGLAEVKHEPDGTLIVTRQFYADRMNRYEIEPDGSLTKHRGALAMGSPETKKDDPNELFMPGWHWIKVRPSRDYYDERQAYRREHARVKPPVPKPAAAEEPNQEKAAIAAAQKKLGWSLPYVAVITYGEGEVRAHLVLRGHSYYEVLDGGYFYHPDLWVTTDRLKFLHRIRATDSGGKVEIKVLKSVPLNLGEEPAEFDCKLGLDQQRGLLYLLLPSGKRYWYDPQTLEAQGQEQLPGVWQREYATVGFTGARKEWPPYAPGLGYALTQTGYERLLRVLTVTFIASLLLLALELMKAWKSTSGRTTAASS